MTSNPLHYPLVVDTDMLSLPDVFPVHRITHPMVMTRSPDSVAWSIVCCSQMQPSAHKVAKKTVEFDGPMVPHWDDIGLCQLS